MEALTAKQQEILTLIRQAIETTGLPPTRAEIAEAMDHSSHNAAEEHLRTLERKPTTQRAGVPRRAQTLRKE